MRAVRRASSGVGKLVDHKNELASLLPGPWGNKEISTALTNLPRVAPLSPGLSLPSHHACPCSSDIAQRHDYSVVSLKLTRLNSQLLQPLPEVWAYARKEVSFTD